MSKVPARRDDRRARLASRQLFCYCDAEYMRPVAYVYRSFKSMTKNRQQLVERTCQSCGLYFCSKKNVKAQINSFHKKPSPSNNSLEMHNVRPSHILTRRSIGRSRAILCVVRKNDDAERLDETDVDLQQSTVPTTDLRDAYPVVSVEESLANPWCEDNVH
ncbi:hypothetical protein EVAR_29844_1 [Eumeta japonica]|uniref:Uncharacterized protein n=1 Tax=Eumeta variegata TaxID=151549 RepID=A0A4C1VSX4_EUMVA|nr:hypothetical protein EVAR_29844_1 [Eumeta japonica]